MKYFVLLAVGFTILIIGANPIYAQYTEHVSDPSLARHHPSWVLGSNDMNYSQFLDFCDNYDSALSDSMSTKERMVSNLCDFRDRGFDEKQWNWLNGTKLDWKNFVQNAVQEQAQNLPLYQKQGIKHTLAVNTSVSGRESFPPPMSATISFDYIEESKTEHFEQRYLIPLIGNMTRLYDLPLQPYVMPPLQQFRSGIPIDQIQCKEGFARVVKLSNNIPICVKSGTVPKLVKRGVITNQFDTANNPGFVIPRGDLLTQNDTHREITILSISPQNVTLPEHKNQTYKSTCSHGACFTPQ